MSVMLLAVVLGCALGLATGGHLRNLANRRFRMWPLLIAGVATQMILGYVPGPARWAVVVADCVAMAAWSWMNRTARHRVSGPDLIGIGVGANAVVIAANGGMPVSRSALGHAGLSPSMDVAKGHLFKHVVMSSHTYIRWLGDFVPLSVFREVVSPGDILMLAGMVITVWSATRTIAAGSNLRLANLATRT